MKPLILPAVVLVVEAIFDSVKGCLRKLSPVIRAVRKKTRTMRTVGLWPN